MRGSSHLEDLAISDAIDTFNLGEDKTQTNEQVLNWNSTKAFIRGFQLANTHAGVKIKRGTQLLEYPDGAWDDVIPRVVSILKGDK